ncbi:MAG: hypothetical protein ACI9OJ_002468 [Myxococcota bacterium]|jgi:hypothetical protein
MSTEPLVDAVISDWETTLRYGFALAQLRTGSEEAAFHALIGALDEVWAEDEAALPSRSELMSRVAQQTDQRRSA